MPPEVFLEIRKQKLFAAGYDGINPVVSYFNEQPPNESFGYLTSGILATGKISLAKPADALQNLSVQEAARLSQQAIQTYAAEGERWKTMGGPTDILCLTPSGSRWIEKNTPDQTYTYTKDLITAHQQGNLPLTLIPPTTHEQLAAFFSTVA
jgi:type II secretory pathway pseudopilin PulG